jgi:phage anti-repressor protein
MGDVWKWLGFSRKEECKRVLTKHFTQNIHYKILTKDFTEENFAPQVGGAKTIFQQPMENKINGENKAPQVGGASKVRGCAGLNKEKILMTVNTFKKLCLKSNTKKADEIHDYFIKLEEIKDEKVVRKAYDPQGTLQDTVFLTSQGVYRLLLINLNAFYFKNLFKHKLL